MMPMSCWRWLWLGLRACLYWKCPWVLDVCGCSGDKSALGMGEGDVDYLLEFFSLAFLRDMAWRSLGVGEKAVSECCQSSALFADNGEEEGTAGAGYEISRVRIHS